MFCPSGYLKNEKAQRELVLALYKEVLTVFEVLGRRSLFKGSSDRPATVSAIAWLLLGLPANILLLFFAVVTPLLILQVSV